MKKKILITALLLILISLFIIPKFFKEEIKLTKEDKEISITLNKELGKEIYELTTIKDKNLIDLDYQNKIDNNIKYLLSNNNYTFNKPLIIYNTYKTNNQSVNIYFKSNKFDKVSYEVKTKGYPKWKKTSVNNKVINKNYGFYITGLIVGEENTIKLTKKNILGFKEENIIKINIPKTIENEKLRKEFLKLEIVEDKSSSKLSEGLYLTNNREGGNVSLYDNDGILRINYIHEISPGFRLVFYKDDLIYSYDRNTYLRMNKLGKITNKYTLGKDIFTHHDYNIMNNLLVVLANKKNLSSRGDTVYTINLDTSEVKKIIDMKDIVGEMKDKAIDFAKTSDLIKFKDAFLENLDWIHMNSLTFPNEEDIILSSRELSAIIYVKNAYQKSKLKYIISEPSVFKDTKLEKYLLKKEGKFTPQAGQHALTYEKNEQDENSYYLTMFNNNADGADSRMDFDWSVYEGINSIYETTGKEKSKIYKYKINEKEKTYELIKEFNVAYTPRQGSVELFGDNYIVGSNYANLIIEYDEEGILLKSFKPKHIHSLGIVPKYDFKDFYFR